MVNKSKKITLITLMLALCSSTYAQEGDFLSALYGSQDEPVNPVDIVGPSNTPNGEVGETHSMNTSKVCTEKDQTSLPLRVLLGLLRQKGASLDISHNVDSGELSIYGGAMIGNCNSMLDFQISEPTSELPYVFQAKIKSCGSDTCTYSVIQDGRKVNIDLPPTQQGFVKCLEATGVMAGGKIMKDKVAPVELSLTKKGINQSSELWFASQGPAAISMTGVYSKGNKKSGVGCFYFEDIVKDGYQVYSQEEVALNRKKDEFQVLCKTGNYKIIDEKIAEFEEFKLLQQMLINVRNKLIEDDVKKLAAELRSAKDYSEIDTSVVNDFYEKIILPKKQQIIDKYKEYLASTGDIKFQKEKELKALQEELSNYGKSPYLDFDSLRSLAASETKHAPLHLDSWHNNMLVLNKALNTIDNYQSFKGTTSGGRKKSPLTADQEINRLQTEYANKLAEARYKHEIRNNIVEGSPSQQFFDKKNALVKAVNNRNQELQQMIQEEMQYIQNYCYNPQKYWLNRQQCVQESQENIAYWQECVKNLNERDINKAQEYQNRGNELAKEEAKRGSRSTANVTNTDNVSDDYAAEKFTFSFKNSRDTGTQMTNQQQQLMMQQQQYQQQFQMTPQYQNNQISSWNPNGLSMEQYAAQNPSWRGGLDYGQYGTTQGYYPQYTGYSNGLNFNLNAGYGQNYGMQNYGIPNYGMQYGTNAAYSPMVGNGMSSYPYINNTGMYNFSFR